MESLEQLNFICCIGKDDAKIEALASWVDESLERRLVCIDDDESSLNDLRDAFFSRLQVKYYLIETPLQIESIAKEAAWLAVMMRSKCLRSSKSWAAQFQDVFEKTHLAAGLLLSDTADCGKTASSNSRFFLKRPLLRGMQLAGKFQNVPAVIVGAGPSLEKNGHLLAQFADSALIFAGGSALGRCQVQPHFAASIDPHMPSSCFEKIPFRDAPFCFQTRLQRENFSLIQGDPIWFPDSHYAFTNWIHGEDKSFDGGWNVSNFLTSIALMMGCNPIIFVGMDLCYADNRKYAHDSTQTSPTHLIEAVSGQGIVSTQKDWVMAHLWTQELALARPDIQFIDAREGGLEWKDPIAVKPLSEILLAKQDGLKERVYCALSQLERFSEETSRLSLWRLKLQQTQEKITQGLANLSLDYAGDEIVDEKLLHPLWHTWRPVFERALDLDPHRESVSQKLQLHRLLFFQKVVQEQLDAI